MKIFNIFIVIIALSLLFYSCATLDALKARSFEKNKQYEDAINYYEKALEKKPDSEKYNQAFDRVKSDYARVITEQASDFLSSNPFNLETLDEVLKILEKAVNLRSAYPETENLKILVIKKREALYKQLDNTIRSMDSFLAKYDWDNALKLIPKAMEIEPREGESLKAEREKIIDNAYDHFWRMSQENYIKRQYVKALSAVEKALKYRSPHNASEFRKKMVKAVKAEKLYKEAQTNLQVKKLDAAVPILKKVLSLNDEKEEARILLANVYYTNGNVEYERGNLLNALEHYRKVVNYKDPYKDIYSNQTVPIKFVKDRVDLIESKIVQICLHRGKEYFSSDLPGNVMLYTKVCKRCLDHPSFDDLINQAQRKIKDSFLWPTFSILDFSRNVRSKRRSTSYIKAEVMMPDQIDQKMEGSYSAYIRPRSTVIDFLYESGINLDFIREWDEKKLKRLSSLVDTKFIIAGNILEFEVNKTRRRESKTKRYVAGTRKNFNPLYSQWYALMTQYEQCESSKSRTTKMGLMGSLLTGNAKHLLAASASNATTSCQHPGSAPDKYLEETIYQDCNYDIYHHDIKGGISTKYVVYDRDTGRIVLDKVEKTTYDKSDMETTGCEAAGVDEDLFELPTEEEVAEQLVQENAASFFELLQDDILTNLPLMYLKLAGNQEDSLYKNEYFAVAHWISLNSPALEGYFKDYCEQVQKSFTNDEFIRLTQKKFLTEKASKGRKWALIVGINRYQDPHVMNLKFAQKDASVMARTLIRKCGFPAQNVKMLVGASAKRSEILAAINKIAQVAIPEDMVVIYFAGHGGFEIDNSQPDGYCKYLLPYDADKRQSFYATAISYAEIASFFEKIKANQLICFLDACYSGAAGGRDFLEGMTRAVKVNPTHLKKLSAGKGRIIITSSDGNQPSLELYEKQHGLFTYYLVKGLDGAADLNPQDGIITILELFEYVSTKVKEEAGKKGTSQEPLLKGEIGGGSQIILTSLLEAEKPRPAEDRAMIELKLSELKLKLKMGSKSKAPVKAGKE